MPCCHCTSSTVIGPCDHCTATGIWLSRRPVSGPISTCFTDMCLWWSRRSCCWDSLSSHLHSLETKVAALVITLQWTHSDHVTLSLHRHWLPVTRPVYPFRWFIFHRRRATSSPSLFQSKVQPAASSCCHCQYCTDAASPQHLHCIHTALLLCYHCISPVYPLCITTDFKCINCKTNCKTN